MGVIDAQTARARQRKNEQPIFDERSGFGVLVEADQDDERMASQMPHTHVPAARSGGPWRIDYPCRLCVSAGTAAIAKINTMASIM